MICVSLSNEVVIISCGLSSALFSLCYGFVEMEQWLEACQKDGETIWDSDWTKSTATICV